MIDGLASQAFQKINMKNMMLSKVQRDNNLFIEIQGAVIITRK